MTTTEDPASTPEIWRVIRPPPQEESEIAGPRASSRWIPAPTTSGPPQVPSLGAKAKRVSLPMAVGAAAAVAPRGTSSDARGQVGSVESFPRPPLGSEHMFMDMTAPLVRVHQPG
mmetsp:Transcript_4665/g.14185  ORF Transcript_4665/g.14185 Transcript_4665/m.14185 type:complete len:115 (-) Transcript_4665:989-1333(-)